ncbi:uncharacterized protein LOC133525080 isoform X2 [Cydia pomonella]|nr:uncharacterized protein LOC133525080 isoform X2 [Cydia pomonella]
MSLEEFKNTLVEQQLKDREAFLKSKKKAEYNKMWADIKATAKLKTTSTLPKQTRREANKTESDLKNTDNKSKTEKVQEYKSNTSHINKQTTKINTVNKSSTAYFRVKLLDLWQQNPTTYSSPTNKADKNNKHSKNINAANQAVNKKPSNVDNDPLSIVEESKNDKELAASNDNQGLSTIDGKLRNIVGEATTIDEDVWKGVDEKELTNIDDKSEEATAEELTIVPTTTSTTTTTTVPTPTTTRRKWSRPRVLLGDHPESASTTS